MRKETRHERYLSKVEDAVKLNLSVATVNFMFEDNIAFIIRACACFGVTELFVIGSLPARSILNPKSGSTYDLVNIKTFKNPHEFLVHTKEYDYDLVSAELDSESVSLYDFEFNLNRKTTLVLGHETLGVPTEILRNSQKIFIPMLGVGYCLNTSQTGTVFLSEYAKQFSREH